jgi:RNA recognition motif-containing protein
MPPLNPPGGVDLVVKGVPRELSKSNVKKEVQSKFGQYGKVIISCHRQTDSISISYFKIQYSGHTDVFLFFQVVRVSFDPPDGATFECVYVTVESHAVASKCIGNLKGTELLGSTIMVSLVPELKKLLAQTRQNCYAILSELPSGWMMLRTFFDVYRQR